MLYCNGCNQEKIDGDFHKDLSCKKGRKSKCKVCVNSKDLRYKLNPQEQRDRVKAYRKNLKDKSPEKLFLSNRKTKLKSTYGITLEDYDVLLRSQNSVCAICSKKEKTKLLAIDHNHTTGVIRGLLCSKCNTALGLVEENIDILTSMKLYLETSR